MGFFRWGSVTVLLLLAVGCGGSTPTDPGPVYPQKTETFTGTVAVGGAQPFPFTVENPGDITVAITGLSPDATLTMGIRLGGWDATALTCTGQLETRAAKVNLVFTGTPSSAGQYCVEIFDIGSLTAPADFVLGMTHY
jgi:hypothetical protein